MFFTHNDRFVYIFELIRRDVNDEVSSFEPRVIHIFTRFILPICMYVFKITMSLFFKVLSKKNASVLTTTSGKIVEKMGQSFKIILFSGINNSDTEPTCEGFQFVYVLIDHNGGKVYTTCDYPISVEKLMKYTNELSGENNILRDEIKKLKRQQGET